MRLRSLPPCYRGCKGLVALWQEALLARKALLVPESGYGHHPQLKRFYMHPTPKAAIE